MELGWLAHGSGQLVDGVGDVVARALAKEHQGSSDGLAKFRSLGIKQEIVRLIGRTFRASPRRVHRVTSRHTNRAKIDLV